MLGGCITRNRYTQIQRSVSFRRELFPPSIATYRGLPSSKAMHFSTVFRYRNRLSTFRTNWRPFDAAGCALFLLPVRLNFVGRSLLHCFWLKTNLSSSWLLATDIAPLLRNFAHSKLLRSSVSSHSSPVPTSAHPVSVTTSYHHHHHHHESSIAT